MEADLAEDDERVDRDRARARHGVDRDAVPAQARPAREDALPFGRRRRGEVDSARVTAVDEDSGPAAVERCRAYQRDRLPTKDEPRARLDTPRRGDMPGRRLPAEDAAPAARVGDGGVPLLEDAYAEATADRGGTRVARRIEGVDKEAIRVAAG